MKINKKLPILLGVITLSYISTLGQIQPIQIQAALTAPASYDYSYQYNSTLGFFNYTSSNGTSPTSIPLFTRTVDGVYYNYSHTFSNSNSHSNTSNYNLPQGLDITMTFNRSNTSWTDGSPTYTGYYSTDTKIGSDATVGTVINKVYLQFDNQTNKDYVLYLDLSSSPTGVGYQYYINSIIASAAQSIDLGAQNTYFIPAYSTVLLRSFSTSSARYFDAWYLKDLGQSAAYNAGVDAGEITGFDNGYAAGLGNNPNILLNGFQAMVGILVNFFLMILNLEVFGVSLMSMFAILAFFVGLIWFLKILRG
jgi:hypothetical protein